MKNLIDRITLKQFLITSALACFLGDLLYSIYLYTKFTNFETFKGLFLLVLKSKGIPYTALTESIIREQLFLVQNSLQFLIIGIIIFHLVNYIFYYKMKRFALIYVKTVIYLGFFCTALFVLTMLLSPSLYLILFILQAMLYAYAFFGIRRKGEEISKIVAK